MAIDNAQSIGFRCAWEDDHGSMCEARSDYVIHVDEPTTYDGTTGLIVSDDRFTQHYGACRDHVAEMSEVPQDLGQAYYNPTYVEWVTYVDAAPRPLMDVLAEHMAKVEADREYAYMVVAGPTGRTFIVDDRLGGEIVSEEPDHDEWNLWTEYRMQDGSLMYESDHEGYQLDAEEFGPIPGDDEGWWFTSAVTGEPCC